MTLSIAQERLDKLDKYLERDDDEISVSSVDSEELDAADGGDVIYLEKGAVPEAVVSGLAERFPEMPPQLVPPMPDWLGALLAGWDLRRHEVTYYLQWDFGLFVKLQLLRTVSPKLIMLKKLAARELKYK